MNAEEIKLLQAQNEALKKQCNSLQQEVKQWKHEYEMLDACIELEQRKVAELQGKLDAYKMSENKANEIIAELKAENERLKEDIKFYNGQLSTRVVMLQKANICLQEIRTIAERTFAVCDDDCGNANKLKEILELTKAEEE